MGVFYSLVWVIVGEGWKDLLQGSSSFEQCMYLAFPWISWTRGVKAGFLTSLENSGPWTDSIGRVFRIFDCFTS